MPPPPPPSLQELQSFLSASEVPTPQSRVYSPEEKLSLSTYCMSVIAEHSLRLTPPSYPLLCLSLTSAKVLLREKDSSSSPLKLPSSLVSYVALASSRDASDSQHDVPLLAMRAMLNALCSTPSLNDDFLRRLNGLEMLTGMLREALPVPLLYQVVRSLHFQCGGPSSSSSVPPLLSSHSLLPSLVSTLSWCARSRSPPFPLGVDRLNLATECLRTLYAVGATHPTYMKGLKPDSGTAGERRDYEAITQLGVLLVEALDVSSPDLRVHSYKLEVLKVLSLMPPSFPQYLVNNGGLPGLLSAFSFQCSRVLVERGGEGTVMLLPALAVLANMARGGGNTTRQLKKGFFPEDREHLYAVVDAGGTASSSSSSSSPPSSSTALSSSASGVPSAPRPLPLPPSVPSPLSPSSSSPSSTQLHPIDCPPATLRFYAVRLLTSVDTAVKRLASELLWDLCGGDAGEFVRRVGFGNAVHFLAVKGVIAMPKAGGGA